MPTATISGLDMNRDGIPDQLQGGMPMMGQPMMQPMMGQPMMGGGYPPMMGGYPLLFFFCFSFFSFFFLSLDSIHFSVSFVVFRFCSSFFYPFVNNKNQLWLKVNTHHNKV